MSIAKTIGRVGMILRKNLPTILSVGACLGVVGTAYLAAKAAPEASKEESTIDKIVDYIPAGLAGAATIACILASDKIHIAREAGFIMSYNALAKSVNADKAKNLAAAGGSAAAMKLANKKEAETEEKWFYDDFASTRLNHAVFYKALWKDVLMTNMHAQDKYQMHGYVSAADYYKELAERTGSPELERLYHEFGSTFGWDCEHLMGDYDCYVGVPFIYDEDAVTTPEGEPCTAIYFDILPEYQEF